MLSAKLAGLNRRSSTWGNFWDAFSAREGSDAVPSMETTRLPHAARRRGGVAGGGARAASDEAPDHRGHGLRHAFDAGRTDGNLWAAAAGAWVDREPNSRNRISICG